MERLEATVASTVYHNEENGYSVVSMRQGNKTFTAVGSMPRLTPGEQVLLEGEWVEHPQYGRQLKCASCEIRKPTTLLGIERYLASGAIKGVGPSTARQIVETFGEETLSVLSEHPERLQQLKGMGKKRWLQIAESFREEMQTREAMIFLQKYGIQPGLAVKISRLYGDRTAEIIQKNPYRLCNELEGVGLVTADRIAMAVGIAQDSEYRVQSALIYVLQEAALGFGHCYLPQSELIRQTAQLLRLSQERVALEVDGLAVRRQIVRSGGEAEEIKVYLPWLDSAEKEVAQRLCELAASRSPLPQHDVEREIADFEEKNGISFGPKQREAITLALQNRVLVITGGPGTGKTTIIRCIISLLENAENVTLCAPTGRAAKRMTEATGKDASTIHRLLEYGGEEGCFTRNAENPLETDCVIVDETSMMDLSLTRSLLRAIEPGTRLILVGDADQLPSVGAGNVLDDIMGCGFMLVSRLTEIYRQEGTSRIVVNAHRINRGEMPLLNEKGTDFFFDREENIQLAAEKISELVTQRLPRFLKMRTTNEIMRNIQVLAPAKKGDCGVWALNARLQQALNPSDPGKPEIRYGETVFRLGDKVIQTKNDYQITWRRKATAGWESGRGIFNGDIGFIIHADEEEHTFTVLFDEEKEVAYQVADMENLELAYCLSIHKSQGSEFPVVIIPVVNGPRMLLTRNLFYTALTRAMRHVVLVGRREVIRQMVENDAVIHRYTSLRERLRLFGEVLKLC